MKPRLTFSAPLWRCACSTRVGYGATPAKAWADWAAGSMPRVRRTAQALLRRFSSPVERAQFNSWRNP